MPQSASQNNQSSQLVPSPYSSQPHYQLYDPSLSAQNQMLQKIMMPTQKARNFENELSLIKGVDQIVIDHSEALKIKRGDLSIIPGDVFKCCPADYKIGGIRLVVKR